MRRKLIPLNGLLQEESKEILLLEDNVLQVIDVLENKVLRSIVAPGLDICAVGDGRVVFAYNGRVRTFSDMSHPKRCFVLAALFRWLEGEEIVNEKETQSGFGVNNSMQDILVDARSADRLRECIEAQMVREDTPLAYRARVSKCDLLDQLRFGVAKFQAETEHLSPREVYLQSVFSIRVPQYTMFVLCQELLPMLQRSNSLALPCVVGFMEQLQVFMDVTTSISSRSLLMMHVARNRLKSLCHLFQNSHKKLRSRQVLISLAEAGFFYYRGGGDKSSRMIHFETGLSILVNTAVFDRLILDPSRVHMEMEPNSLHVQNKVTCDVSLPLSTSAVVHEHSGQQQDQIFALKCSEIYTQPIVAVALVNGVINVFNFRSDFSLGLCPVFSLNTNDDDVSVVDEDKAHTEPTLGMGPLVDFAIFVRLKDPVSQDELPVPVKPAAWYMVGVKVTILAGEHEGKQGVIKRIGSESISVLVNGLDERQEFEDADLVLSPTPPMVDDSIILISTSSGRREYGLLFQVEANRGHVKVSKKLESETGNWVEITARRKYPLEKMLAVDTATFEEYIKAPEAQILTPKLTTQSPTAKKTERFVVVTLHASSSDTCIITCYSVENSISSKKQVLEINESAGSLFMNHFTCDLLLMSGSKILSFEWNAQKCIFESTPKVSEYNDAISDVKFIPKVKAVQRGDLLSPLFTSLMCSVAVLLENGNVVVEGVTGIMSNIKAFSLFSMSLRSHLRLVAMTNDGSIRQISTNKQFATDEFEVDVTLVSHAESLYEQLQWESLPFMVYPTKSGHHRVYSKLNGSEMSWVNSGTLGADGSESSDKEVRDCSIWDLELRERSALGRLFLHVQIQQSVFTRTGLALQFTGVEYAQAQITTQIQGCLTIEAWMRVDEAAGELPILELYSKESTSLKLVLTADGMIELRLRSDSQYFATTPIDTVEHLTRGTWHHVAGVLGPNGLELYVNGDYYGAGVITRMEWRDYKQVLKIGGDHFQGCISHVRLWTASRSQQEIRDYTDASVSPTCKGLVAYWPMDTQIDGALLSKTIPAILSSAESTWIQTKVPVIDYVPGLKLTVLALDPSPKVLVDCMPMETSMEDFDLGGSTASRIRVTITSTCEISAISSVVLSLSGRSNCTVENYAAYLESEGIKNVPVFSISQVSKVWLQFKNELFARKLMNIIKSPETESRLRLISVKLLHYQVDSKSCCWANITNTEHIVEFLRACFVNQQSDRYSSFIAYDTGRFLEDVVALCGDAFPQLGAQVFSGALSVLEESVDTMGTANGVDQLVETLQHFWPSQTSVSFIDTFSIVANQLIVIGKRLDMHRSSQHNVLRSYFNDFTRPMFDEFGPNYQCIATIFKGNEGAEQQQIQSNEAANVTPKSKRSGGTNKQTVPLFGEGSLINVHSKSFNASVDGVELDPKAVSTNVPTNLPVLRIKFKNVQSETLKDSVLIVDLGKFCDIRNLTAALDLDTPSVNFALTVEAWLGEPPHSGDRFLIKDKDAEIELYAFTGNFTYDRDGTLGVKSCFPTVIPRHVNLVSGKWYYEVLLVKTCDGVAQVGWADQNFSGSDENATGTGDDMHSWAYDGFRQKKWNDGDVSWGRKWADGMVVGCAADVDSRILSFSLDGNWQAPMGKAFTGIKFSNGIFPAITGEKSFKYQVNFGQKPFRFGPPSEHKSILDWIRENDSKASHSASFSPEEAIEKFVKGKKTVINDLTNSEEPLLSGIRFKEQLIRTGDRSNHSNSPSGGVTIIRASINSSNCSPCIFSGSIIARYIKVTLSSLDHTELSTVNNQYQDTLLKISRGSSQSSIHTKPGGKGEEPLKKAPKHFSELFDSISKSPSMYHMGEMFSVSSLTSDLTPSEMDAAKQAPTQKTSSMINWGEMSSPTSKSEVQDISSKKKMRGGKCLISLSGSGINDAVPLPESLPAPLLSGLLQKYTKALENEFHDCGNLVQARQKLELAIEVLMNAVGTKVAGVWDGIDTSKSWTTMVKSMPENHFLYAEISALKSALHNGVGHAMYQLGSLRERCDYLSTFCIDGDAVQHVKPVYGDSLKISRLFYFEGALTGLLAEQLPDVFLSPVLSLNQLEDLFSSLCVHHSVSPDHIKLAGQFIRRSLRGLGRAASAAFVCHALNTHFSIPSILLPPDMAFPERPVFRILQSIVEGPIASVAISELLAQFPKGVESNPELIPLIGWTFSLLSHALTSEQSLDKDDTPNKSVHFNCVCESCGCSPIIGARFKCVNLPDVDFCEDCEAWKKYPGNNFVFLKIPRPLPLPPSADPRKASVLGALLPNLKTVAEKGKDLDSDIVDVVHEGVVCDSCGMEPITGVRHKCVNCDEYNLCSQCEPKNGHFALHLFLKLRRPLPFDQNKNPVALIPDQSVLPFLLHHHSEVPISRSKSHSTIISDSSRSMNLLDSPPARRSRGFFTEYGTSEDSHIDSVFSLLCSDAIISPLQVEIFLIGCKVLQQLVSRCTEQQVSDGILKHSKLDYLLDQVNRCSNPFVHSAVIHLFETISNQSTSSIHRALRSHLMNLLPQPHEPAFVLELLLVTLHSFGSERLDAKMVSKILGMFVQVPLSNGSIARGWAIAFRILGSYADPDAMLRGEGKARLGAALEAVLSGASSVVSFLEDDMISLVKILLEYRSQDAHKVLQSDILQLLVIHFLMASPLNPLLFRRLVGALTESFKSDTDPCGHLNADALIALLSSVTRALATESSSCLDEETATTFDFDLITQVLGLVCELLLKEDLDETSELRKDLLHTLTTSIGGSPAPVHSLLVWLSDSSDSLPRNRLGEVIVYLLSELLGKEDDSRLVDSCVSALQIAKQAERVADVISTLVKRESLARHLVISSVDDQGCFSIIAALKAASRSNAKPMAAVTDFIADSLLEVEKSPNSFQPDITHRCKVLSDNPGLKGLFVLEDTNVSSEVDHVFDDQSPWEFLVELPYDEIVSGVTLDFVLSSKVKGSTMPSRVCIGTGTSLSRISPAGVCTSFSLKNTPTQISTEISLAAPVAIRFLRVTIHKPLDSKNPPSDTAINLNIGDTVIRGKDWKYGMQDGGSTGQVISLCSWNSDLPGQWLRVRWANGTENAYRYGHLERRVAKYDLAPYVAAHSFSEVTLAKIRISTVNTALSNPHRNVSSSPSLALYLKLFSDACKRFQSVQFALANHKRAEDLVNALIGFFPDALTSVHARATVVMIAKQNVTLSLRLLDKMLSVPVYNLTPAHAALCCDLCTVQDEFTKRRLKCLWAFVIEQDNQSAMMMALLHTLAISVEEFSLHSRDGLNGFPDKEVFMNRIMTHAIEATENSPAEQIYLTLLCTILRADEGLRLSVLTSLTNTVNDTRTVITMSKEFLSDEISDLDDLEDKTSCDVERLLMTMISSLRVLGIVCCCHPSLAQSSTSLLQVIGSLIIPTIRAVNEALMTEHDSSLFSRPCTPSKKPRDEDAAKRLRLCEYLRTLVHAMITTLSDACHAIIVKEWINSSGLLAQLILELRSFDRAREDGSSSVWTPAERKLERMRVTIHEALDVDKHLALTSRTYDAWINVQNASLDLVRRCMNLHQGNQNMIATMLMQQLAFADHKDSFLVKLLAELAVLSPQVSLSVWAPSLVIDDIVNGNNPNAPMTSETRVFKLDSANCGSTISVENDGAVGVQVSFEKWGMIRADTPLPLSGVSSWNIHIDLSPKGHIFVGVATKDSNLNSYLGNDKFGWGYIGNRGVWHNKHKVKTYGKDFRTGYTVTVTVDMDEGSISFAVNGEDLGVAFGEDLKGKELFPAFALYQKGDRFTISDTSLARSETGTGAASKSHPVHGITSTVKFHRPGPVFAVDALLTVQQALDVIGIETPIESRRVEDNRNCTPLEYTNDPWVLSDGEIQIIDLQDKLLDCVSNSEVIHLARSSANAVEHSSSYTPSSGRPFHYVSDSPGGMKLVADLARLYIDRRVVDGYVSVGPNNDSSLTLEEWKSWLDMLEILFCLRDYASFFVRSQDCLGILFTLLGDDLNHLNEISRTALAPSPAALKDPEGAIIGALKSLLLDQSNEQHLRLEAVKNKVLDYLLLRLGNIQAELPMNPEFFSHLSHLVPQQQPQHSKVLSSTATEDSGSKSLWAPSYGHGVVDTTALDRQRDRIIKDKQCKTVLTVQCITCLFDCDLEGIEEVFWVQVLDSLTSSALLRILMANLFGTSTKVILDSLPLYESLLKLIRGIASHQPLAGFLGPTSGVYRSVVQLLEEVDDILQDADEEELTELKIMCSSVRELATSQYASCAAESVSSPKAKEQGDQTLLTALNDFYETTMKPLMFANRDMCDTEGRYVHHFRGQIEDDIKGKTSQGRTRRLNRELKALKNSLPLHYSSSISIRVDTSRPFVGQCIIFAPGSTPYDSGCFLFDIYFPPEYPSEPPKINLMTTGSGTVRFNPNLYNNGKVCLSLLGTWRGGATGSENWTKNSTVWQVLVSIQSAILGSEFPYFNEPGVESQWGTAEGEFNKRVHTNGGLERLRVATIQFAMVAHLKNPPLGFEEVIRYHFKIKARHILSTCDTWLSDAKTSDTKGHFKALAKQVSDLTVELNKLGADSAVEEVYQQFHHKEAEQDNNLVQLLEIFPGIPQQILQSALSATEVDSVSDVQAAVSFLMDKS